MTSGDGWVYGPDGRRYWGLFGAAGLLAVDQERGVLLQHRIAWSDFGGTWGVPGGARNGGESAMEAAFREASEEAAVPRDALEVLFSRVLDLTFWSYTTVVCRVVTPFEARISDVESAELRWVACDAVQEMPLHPGFAASWPSLRAEIESCR